MQRLLPLVILVVCASQSFGQAIPPRLQPLLKNERFRLLRVLGTPELPASFGHMSAISSDGKRAVYGEDLSTQDADKLHLQARLSVWDQTDAWPREIEISGKSVQALVLSADGKRVLLAGLVPGPGSKRKSDKKAMPIPLAYLSLLELDTGKELHTVTTKGPSFQSVALASDGVTALAVDQNAVKRWDLKAGREIGSYQVKDVQPAAVAFLPDGKHFLAAYVSAPKEKPAPAGVMRWHIDQPKPVAVYGTEDSYELSVSRDGKRFAVAHMPLGITLWDVDPAKKLKTLQMEKGDDKVPTAIAVASDGQAILCTWTNTNAAPDEFTCSRLIAWDGVAGKQLWAHPVSYRGRPPLLVRADTLTVGGGPNLRDEWDIKTGTLRSTRGAHKGPVNAIAVLADGNVISGGLEGIAMTWRKGPLAGKRKIHDGPIGAMTASRDGQYWLSAGADRTVMLHGASSDKPIHTLKGHRGPITALAFGKDGMWAATASSDRTVKTWNLKAGKEIATLPEQADVLNAVAISPDDRWLASGSDDATIRIWPIKEGKLDADREVIVLDGHSKAVTSLAFTPDGKTLVSGSQDNTLKVWDWAKEKVTRTIPGHKNWITSVLVIDAKTVLTTSDDLSICLWDLASGKELGRIDFGAVGDCPRCMARLGADQLLVGTSNWLIYEFQMVSPK